MNETIFTAIGASVLVNGSIIWLLKGWVTARLKASIDSEYKRQHELFTRKLDRIEKVEIVSDLLAEWIRYPPSENMSREDRTRLNKLSFKSSLWLRPELSKELAKVLQNKKDSKSIFEILLMARKDLIDDEEIGPKHVTIWGAEHETKADSADAS